MTAAAPAERSGAVRIRAVITGVVQGVWFRQGCAAEARRAGVAGWVRNRDDGSVEAELEGPVEAVAGVLDWMGTGPPAAKVTGVQVEERSPDGQRSFEVR